MKRREHGAERREDRGGSGEPHDSRAKARTAPDPDHPSKPDNPTDISRPAWSYLIKRTVREFGRDQCTTLAAALTYYAVLAIFPALLALVSFVGLFGQAEVTTRALVDLIESVGDESTAETFRGPIEALASGRGAGFALVVGLLGAIWSASGYVNGFTQAMNRIYEIDEGRPFWKLRPIVLALTVVLLGMAMVVVLLAIASGPVAEGIGDLFGLGEVALLVWTIAKWPIVVFLAVLMIAVLYYGTPNVKQPRFRWMSVGAFIALLVMALATLGFFFYVANFSNYQRVYGGIAGVIIALLWLWIVNLSLLFGAEFDAEMERARQLQAGIEAEDTLQLPPRDVRRSDKAREKEDEDIERGRELREEHGDAGDIPQPDDEHGNPRRR